MKKLVTGLIGLVVLALGQPVFADQTSVTVPVVVAVPQRLNLDVVVRQVVSPQDPSQGADVFDTTTGITTGMNFGTLTYNSYGVWASAYYFTAFLYPATSGRPYTITQTCAGIVNGTNNLNKSFTMSPDFQTADSFSKTAPFTPQPAMTTANPGSSLGNPGLAVGANTKIFDSGSGGNASILRCYYGLATGNTNPANGAVDPPGAVPLTSSSVAGTYAGSVTFTIVLK